MSQAIRKQAAELQVQRQLDGLFNEAVDTASDDKSSPDKNLADTRQAVALVRANFTAWTELGGEQNTIVDLIIDPQMEDQGQTTIFVYDEKGTKRSLHDGLPADQWTSMIDSKPVRIIVAVNPSKMDPPGPETIAHTINHELSLHALNILRHVRALREVPAEERATRVQANFKGEGDPERQHEQFVYGENTVMLQSHQKMLDAASGNNLKRKQLAEDYKADWQARREFLIWELKTKLAKVYDVGLEDVDEDYIYALGTTDAEKLQHLTNYTFDHHCAEVYEAYSIKLNPDR